MVCVPCLDLVERAQKHEPYFVYNFKHMCVPQTVCVVLYYWCSTAHKFAFSCYVCTAICVCPLQLLLSDYLLEGTQPIFYDFDFLVLYNLCVRKRLVGGIAPPTVVNVAPPHNNHNLNALCQIQQNVISIFFIKFISCTTHNLEC